MAEKRLSFWKMVVVSTLYDMVGSPKGREMVEAWRKQNHQLNAEKKNVKIQERNQDKKNEKANADIEATKASTMHAKRSSGFFGIIKTPLLLWLGFYIVFLIAGIINLPGLPAMLLFSNYIMFFGLLFGLWLGRNASRNSNHFSLALTSSFTTAFIIGIIGFVFVAGLNAYSSSFAATVFGAPAALSITLLLQYFTSSWIEIILTTMLAAAVGFEFSRAQ
ncbi:MAG: hypothetical protein ACP5UN_03475 [Candidatus Micrarchaeia archaeon]